MAIYGNIENVDAVLLATVTAEVIHVKGADGKDGASITISNIIESTADGGTNTVTFSDGSALNVKNGSKGSAGADGRDGAPGAPGTPGKDGHSPVVTATKSGKTTTISVDGAAIATVEDGADGKPGAAGQAGAAGADGITPHIGDNGNWYIGSEDTGKPSRGAAGVAGAPGKDGADGHTPVKGTDYWTASDKAEVVAEAAAAVDLTPYAKKTEVPTKTSQLTNDSGFLTSHQDISGKQDKSTLEADVAAKGFTKNTGTYSKPAGGIPKDDLAAAVQTSLGKADTALQEHQSLAAYRTAAAQNIIDSGKQDKLIAGENITIASDGKTISATGGGAETLFVTITDNNGTLSADKPYYEIIGALHDGIPVLVDYGGMDLPLIGIADALYFGAFQCDSGDASNSAVIATTMIEITPNGEVNDFSAQVDIPKTLPNPNALTFTGAVTGSYDGSEPLSVNIPTAPTKTSQLENDSGYLTLATLPKYGGEVV